MKHFAAIAIALLLAVCAGCTSNPVKTPRGDYYSLDTKVTAVDAGVLHFVNDCKATVSVSQYCTPANLSRLAQATTALGTAMDGYSAAVRDPNFDQGNLERASAIVSAALATVEALLAEFGVQTP